MVEKSSSHPSKVVFLLFFVILISFISPSHCAYSWKNVKITAGGFINGILFHPNQKELYYATTDIGGSYRYDTPTKTWIPLTDFLAPGDYNLMGVEALAIDPSNVNRLYAAVGMYTASWASNGAILRSEDRGNTWTKTSLSIKLGGNENGRFAGPRFAVDPNKNSILYFGSRNDGLWCSVDTSATWTKVTTFPVTGSTTNGVGIVFVLFHKSSSSTGSATPYIYVGVSQANGIYRSTDAGKTWSQLSSPNTYVPIQGVITSTSLFITYGNAPGPNGMTAGAVYRYTIASGTWMNVSPITGDGFGFAGLSVSASNAKLVMVSTMDRWWPGDTIFRSIDGGQTWKDVGSKSTRSVSVSPWITFGGSSASFGWWIGALAIDPYQPGHVLYGTGATIWESNNAEQADSGLTTSWSVGANGIEETAVLDLISPTSGPRLFSGLGDISGFKHDDLTVSPPEGMYNTPKGMSNCQSLDFSVYSPNVIVRVGGNLGAISRDSGTNWTPFDSVPTGDGSPNSISIGADATIIVWSHGGVPHYSVNGGSTWVAATGLPSGAMVISDRIWSGCFYAWASGTVYLSQDGAKSFTRRATGLLTSGTLRAVPGVQGEVWINLGNSWDGGCGLYQSKDYGATFTKLTTVGYVSTFGFGKAPSGKTFPAIYIQGSVNNVNALYRSDDQGATWVRINDNLHQFGGATHVIGDPRTYGRVYIGTNGRGILYGDISTSGVVEDTTISTNSDRSSVGINTGSDGDTTTTRSAVVDMTVVIGIVLGCIVVLIVVVVALTLKRRQVLERV